MIHFRSFFSAGVAFLCLSAVQAQQPVKHSTGDRISLEATLVTDKPGVPEQDPWMVSMRRTAIYHHHSDSLRTAKNEKLGTKTQSLTGVGVDQGGRAVTPQAGTGVNGTEMTNWTPPDNTMAISNNGRIVAADNEDISYFTESGSFQGSSTHTSFFNGVATTNSLFDPRLIYDSEADRFIYVILHGNSSSTSKILVCFSKSNNPFTDGWWIYQLSGNPLNNSCWTDYPNIGVSTDDLYITGNLFSSFNNQFNQAIIYQIDKSDGYAGASSLGYDVWNNISDGNGGGAFTIVPATHGQQGNYGPNFYFVSSRSGGYNFAGNGRISLYEMTNSQSSGQAQLDVTGVVVSPYEPAADANQQGSGDLLDVGDCRMHHAFYLNGIVHAVHALDYEFTAYCGIRYYRIPVNSPSATTDSDFGLSGFDYAYPSLASFGLQECDQSVMIGMLRSGSSIYPEMRVVNCDNDMNWSSSTQLVAGQGYLNFLSGHERWGDYTQMQRKHNATSPEVWLAGCYANSGHRYRTFISEVKGTYEPAPTPTADFQISDTSGAPNFYVNFYDNSAGNPVSWQWTFEGGIPSTSSAQNPLVVYMDTGMFDVKLVVENDYCKDSLMVENLIQVYRPKIDTDTVIFEGQTVIVVQGDTFELFDGEWVSLGVDELPADHAALYPNPVQAAQMMHIDIHLEKGGFVEIRILDLLGREVKDLHSDYVRAGEHQLSFNQLALPSGQYILEMKVNAQILKHEKLVVQH